MSENHCFLSTIHTSMEVGLIKDHAFKLLFSYRKEISNKYVHYSVFRMNLERTIPL